MKLPLKVILFSFTANLVSGYNILGVFPFCGHSHFFLGFRLLKELADRGHNVTLVNCFPRKEAITNFRDVSVEEVVYRNEIYDAFLELNDFANFYYWEMLQWRFKVSKMYTREVFKSKSVQELINSDDTFDLVIMEDLGSYSLAIFQYKFNCPLIILAPGPMTIFNNHLFDNPSPPSYVPNLLTSFGSSMNFWERMQNTCYQLFGELFEHFIVIPGHDKIVKEYFSDAPDLTTVLYNVSLILTTSTISLSDPVPFQQNIKEIGGYHVTEPKPLPKDIKDFLDSAVDGAILFSMGSVLKSDNFDSEKREAILKVFSKMKQKVIWKFETDFVEKPNNVMIVKWLPQQDILAHPNVIGFIAHGGLLGSIEAIYFGVPILGLPVFWDQVKNIEDAVRKGFGIRLEFEKLNEESFGEALNELLNNQTYRKNAQESSRIMHDRPMKQIDEAVFWVEYVIRHKGATHLKSTGLYLKWYQKYLVDIVVFVTVLCIIILLALIFLVKLLFCKIHCTNKKIKVN